MPAGPGHGGVVVSDSQSRNWTGSAPRNAVTTIVGLAMVYAWLSPSANGGENVEWWWRTSPNPQSAAVDTICSRSW
ncbi:hypothetical protein ACOBQX_02910 [Actinokineospora sp. G85]|uniref:hypothetical protein n=1 Tax=Actinokineospora sp. G85 TaxID=3406626 RepID=UPI003C76078B